jgi:anti-sigma B factor antagonist
MFERIHSEEGLVRLHLRGGLDGDASRAMRDGLAALAAVEAREVVIDFSNVTFIDGSGLGAISFLFKRLTARGRRLTVSGVSGQPLAMLRHLGLAGLLGLDGEGRRSSFLSLPGMAWAR